MSILNWILLVDTNARMRLKAEASRLYLGWAWLAIEPLLWVTIFYLVFEVFLSRGKGEGFIIFLMIGKIPFLWFSKSVNRSSTSIMSNRQFIGKFYTPKVYFPYVAVQQVLYQQRPAFSVLIVSVLLAGYTLDANWFWLLPLLTLQYLLILLLSLVAALAVAFFEDLKILIPLGILFLMFVSGIFWDVNDIADHNIKNLVLANPLAFLIDAYRQILIKGEFVGGYRLAVLLTMMLIGLLLIHYLYGKLDTKVAEKVLNS